MTRMDASHASMKKRDWKRWGSWIYWRRLYRAKTAKTTIGCSCAWAMGRSLMARDARLNGVPLRTMMTMVLYGGRLMKILFARTRMADESQFVLAKETIENVWWKRGRCYEGNYGRWTRLGVLEQWRWKSLWWQGEGNTMGSNWRLGEAKGVQVDTNWRRGRPRRLCGWGDKEGSATRHQAKARWPKSEGR